MLWLTLQLHICTGHYDVYFRDSRSNGPDTHVMCFGVCKGEWWRLPHCFTCLGGWSPSSYPNISTYVGGLFVLDAAELNTLEPHVYMQFMYILYYMQVYVGGGTEHPLALRRYSHCVINVTILPKITLAPIVRQYAQPKLYSPYECFVFICVVVVFLFS